MSEHVDKFVEEASGIVSAESVNEGEYIHVYRGDLDSVDGVRILSLAPDISDSDIHDAFRHTADQWENPSSHPNIVTVQGRGTTPRPWLAVEDVDGERLKDACADLSMAEIGKVITDSAEAIRNANLYNAVHSALSPDVIWIIRQDGGVLAQVDDWGLERSCRVAAGETPLSVYSAPELVDDPENATAQTDIYGLGAVAYYALTGQPPVGVTDGNLSEALTQGELTPPSQLNPSITSEIDGVVLKALSRSPTDRHQSSHEFQNDFVNSLSESEQLSALDVDTIQEETTSRQVESRTRSGSESEQTTSTTDQTETDTTTSRNQDEMWESESSSFLSRRKILAGLGIIGLGAVGWRVTSSEFGGSDIDTPTPTPVSTETAAQAETATATPTATVTPTENTSTQPPQDEETPTPESTPTPQQERDKDAMYHEDPRNHGVVQSPQSDPPSRELTVRWQFEADNKIRTAPAIVGDTVYFGTDRGTLYAVDAIEGSERWSEKTESDNTARSSPAVVGGTVYIGMDNNKLYAFDAETGSEEWTFETLGPVRTAPKVVNGTVYFGCDDRHVYALNAADGSELWTHRTRGKARTSPAITSDHVYVGKDNNTLYQLDRADGSKIWTFDTEQLIRTAPVVGDGIVYFGTTDTDPTTSDGKLYAINTQFGETEWFFDEPNDIADSPVLVDGTIYAVDVNNRVYSVDATTGSENWSFNTFNRIFASPTYVSGQLYVSRFDGGLSVFSDSGSRLASFSTTTGKAFRSTPAVYDGSVYVGSDDQQLYALEEV